MTSSPEGYDRTAVATISCEDAKAFVCDAVWGLAEVDADGRFVWLNQAYAEILNAPISLVIGTRFADWTYEEDLQQDQDLADAVRRDEIDSYNLAKRYVQRGSTEANPRVVWGMLTVAGKWDKTGKFAGYRVQFQPYDLESQKAKPKWQEIGNWILQNWKTILAIVIAMGSLISGGYATLSSASMEAKEAVQAIER